MLKKFIGLAKTQKAIEKSDYFYLLQAWQNFFRDVQRKSKSQPHLSSFKRNLALDFADGFQGLL